MIESTPAPAADKPARCVTAIECGAVFVVFYTNAKVTSTYNDVAQLKTFIDMQIPYEKIEVWDDNRLSAIIF